MDLLWKKENEKPDALYIDIFKNVARDYPTEYKTMTSTSEDAIPTPMKSDSVSKDLRKKGNEAFLSKNWTEAIQYYHVSLCFAEIGSENVGVAYSNRSACFFRLKMYRKCIIDIDLAIKANCPERLFSKLENRRNECLKLMPQEVKEIAPQLDFEEDKNFPGLASVLQMKSNKLFGRHFIAKTDIGIGKIVLVEEPFVSYPILDRKDLVCHTCFTMGSNFIACGKCTEAIFCSPNCMSDGFHEIRCGKGDTKNDSIDHAARSILKAVGIFLDVDSLIEFVEKVIHTEKKTNDVPNSTIDLKNKYHVFLQLNLVMTGVYKNKLLDGYRIYDYLMKIPTIKQQFTTERCQRFLMHLSLMHYCLVTCNIFITTVGKGLYPLSNHFNNSCAPNLLNYYYGNKRVLITSRPIRKGDQLFIAYMGNLCWFIEKSDRHEFLNQNFAFKCDCEKCANDGKPVDAHRLNQIEADSDYQYIKNYSVDCGDIPEHFAFRKKCFDVLAKYGNGPWTKQLDLVSSKLQLLLNDAETMYYFNKMLD